MNDETKCVYCGDPSAHPGTRKCSDSTACELRMAQQDVRTLREALERANEGVRYWTDLAQAEARDAAALRARVAELETQAAARYDCKGGPGTTAPACGGCVTCLHRVIEQAEARAEKAEAQVAARREPLPQVVLATALMLVLAELEVFAPWSEHSMGKPAVDPANFAPSSEPLIHPSNFSEPLREEIEREREATPRPAPPSSSIK